ncbi:MAG: thiolase domain-containing protein [Chloroflexi bacterium]|nr:thiolase domain-containing protein [Chloroflexota bacterium]
MRGVSIIGIGSTPFGRLTEISIRELAVRACRAALADANVPRELAQAFYLGNYAADVLVGQNTLAPLIANALGLRRIPCTKIEGACASAGIALRHGYLLVATGVYDVVLVAGVEKMTSASTPEVTAALAAAADLETEVRAGLTFPGAFALVARRHMHDYGTTREQIAMVSVKNHHNSVRNDVAQFKKEVSVAEVVGSRLVADPLRLYDCCPISDGAAAVVLCAADRAHEFTDRPVDIVGSGHALGAAAMCALDDLTSFGATRDAADEAFAQAGIERADVDVVELHDCFSIAEIVDSEDLGFFAKGQGGRAVAEGWTATGGRIPVNPSGGLLSKGHPVGATGLGQVYEVVRQLRGEHPNQVPDAQFGLAHNLGGTGAVATVHILRRRL